MNTDIEGKDNFGEEDSSVTRTNEKFRALVQDAGLLLVKTELQTGFQRNSFL